MIWVDLPGVRRLARRPSRTAGLVTKDDLGRPQRKEQIMRSGAFAPFGVWARLQLRTLPRGGDQNSHEVAPAFKALLERSYRVMGFAIPPWPCALRRGLRGFPNVRCRRGRLSISASSSRGLASPSELDRNRPPQPSRVQPLPWGSLPFSACERRSLRFPGLPRPVRSAFRIRQPSWRFASPASSTALFHAAHARGSPSEAFPFTERERASRRALTLVPSAQTVRDLLARLARLQGLAPSGSPLHAAPSGPGERPEAPLGLRLCRGFLPPTTTRGFPPVSSPGLPTGIASRAGPSESRS